MADPWYSQSVQQINQLRTSNDIVKGLYTFSDFHLDQVTTDGRIIFTDCQTNGQETYNAETGARVTNTGTYNIQEQVVVYHPNSTTWRVADENQQGPHSCAG